MFPELGVDDFDDLPEATEKKEDVRSDVKSSRPVSGTYGYSKNNRGADMQKTMRNVKY